MARIIGTNDEIQREILKEIRHQSRIITLVAVFLVAVSLYLVAYSLTVGL
jgi:predicted KAP-like P-loop ATPase